MRVDDSPPVCQDCETKTAEYEIRKFSDDVESSGRRTVCKSCLGLVLAEDTASLVRISRPGTDAPLAA